MCIGFRVTILSTTGDYILEIVLEVASRSDVVQPSTAIMIGVPLISEIIAPTWAGGAGDWTTRPGWSSLVSDPCAKAVAVQAIRLYRTGFNIISSGCVFEL